MSNDPTWDYFQNKANRNAAITNMTNEKAGDILDLAGLAATPKRRKSSTARPAAGIGVDLAEIASGFGWWPEAVDIDDGVAISLYRGDIEVHVSDSANEDFGAVFLLNEKRITDTTRMTDVFRWIVGHGKGSCE